MKEERFIEVRGLRKDYGGVVAVENLDLSIARGDIVTLLGPSGCGKTTTLRCIAGLETPTAGVITIAGLEVDREGHHAPPRDRNIGMVFQGFALWPHMRVRDNVAFPLRRKGLPKAEVLSRTESVLSLVGLSGRAHHFPGELSGGQQQRVALARALVSVVSQRTSVLLVNPAFPARNLVEYLAYAKANPGRINYGTTGAGSGSHLAGAWLHTAANSRVTFVHYKGIAQALQEVVAGRIDVSSGTMVLALPLIKSGKAKPVVILNDQRNKLMPDLPTVAEQGIPDFNFSNWLGFLAPAATPVAIVNKLGEGLATAARAPEVIAALEAGGSVAVGSTPAQFRQLVATEVARWRNVIKTSGIKLTGE